MSTEVFDNADPSLDAVVIRQRPNTGTTDNHALAVHQQATSGLGQALRLISDNPDVPALTIKAAGDAVNLVGSFGTSDVPDPATKAELPGGYGNSQGQTGIYLPSSYPSDDTSGGIDGTARLNLYSYQRANTYSFGETIRNFMMRSDAKSMTAWYMPVVSATDKSGYVAATRDPQASGVQWRPVTWSGSHFEANDHNSIHGHWELEIPDASGALQGRLEIPFIDQAVDGSKSIDNVPIGVDYTNIRTNLADLSVRAQNILTGPYAGQSTCLRIGGNNSVNKDIRLSISSDMSDSGRRWALRANTDSESGSNAGTNFALLRYADDGTLLGTTLAAERSTGNVTLGAAAGGRSARMAAVWSTSGYHGFSAQPSSSPGAGAAFDAQLTASTDRGVQLTVSGDANRRFVILTSGEISWGDGTASRDVNLYRATADVLKTDDSLTVGVNLRINTTSVAAGVGVLAMANATTLPSGTPSGGGVIYVEGGALKYKGSSGTITTIANA